MQKILIDPSLFDFDEDIEAFAASIKAIAGETTKVSTLYALEIEDPKIARCVTVFLGTLTHLKKPAASKTAPKAKEEKKIPTETENWRKKPRKQILYTFTNGERAGVTVRGPELHRMLKQGKIPSGTRLSHPMKGKLITSGWGSDAQLMQITRDEEETPVETILDSEPVAVPA